MIILLDLIADFFPRFGTSHPGNLVSGLCLSFVHLVDPTLPNIHVITTIARSRILTAFTAIYKARSTPSSRGCTGLLSKTSRCIAFHHYFPPL